SSNLWVRQIALEKLKDMPNIADLELLMISLEEEKDPTCIALIMDTLKQCIKSSGTKNIGTLYYLGNLLTETQNQHVKRAAVLGLEAFGSSGLELLLNTLEALPPGESSVLRQDLEKTILSLSKQSTCLEILAEKAQNVGSPIQKLCLRAVFNLAEEWVNKGCPLTEEKMIETLRALSRHESPLIRQPAKAALAQAKNLPPEKTNETP
ncbi:MAG: hypothetical protein K2X66_16195, partial [Cyanobacteria bacterium]|nr:hypothetical protein [Cyanobacteriota bacterium]